jgi:dTDP-4-amino-4,6-dideoxygalactose transaminase
MTRVFLSPPHQTSTDQAALLRASSSGWLAPLGPEVDAFQGEFATAVASRYAVALSSGTAALHLALIAAEVGAGDEVWCSSLTFAASANPILYVGATPTFIDSEWQSWNLDPEVVKDAFASRVVAGLALPKALIAVHLYGQTADIDRLKAYCDQYGVTLIEDAAEALGSSYKGRHPGNDSFAGIFSFNGNKIITTSGGGMLVTPHESVAKLALKLATQAREPAPHYEHQLIGYNYRLSNLLAALGRSQLATLNDRVTARRRIFDRYLSALGNLPGIVFQPEAPWGTPTRWLTCCLIDPNAFGVDREVVRLALEAADIESRPLWKPMHLQPVFKGCEFIGEGIADLLFERGLCLPSGSGMTDEQQDRVINVIAGLVS